MGSNGKVAHVGLDNHRNFSIATGRDADNQVVFRRRLDHHNRPVLRQELGRWPAGTPVVLEGSFGWGWMADELQEAGHVPHLASSRKMAKWREAHGVAKSNRIDADLLSELWPQQPRWWEVWLAPAEVRDQREVLRYRMALVRVQTMTKNRIHATLHRHGVLHPYSDLFGKGGWAFLAELTAEASPLRAAARQTLAGHLRLLRQLRQQIAAVTRQARQAVSRSPQGEAWRGLPGIGWVLAYTIQAEVGELSRFRDGDHLASYSLLVPRADDSGDEDGGPPLGRHVGHQGRLTLKWAFIEAAHGAVRKSRFFRALFDRHTDGGRRDKNRGYIAVARKLCVVGAACVRKGQPFREAPPPRPGVPASPDAAPAVPTAPAPKEKKGRSSKQCKRSTINHNRKPRPGLGQPDHPMAVAGL
jgi:transposase